MNHLCTCILYSFEEKFSAQTNATCFNCGIGEGLRGSSPTPFGRKKITKKGNFRAAPSPRFPNWIMIMVVDKLVKIGRPPPPSRSAYEFRTERCVFPFSLGHWLCTVSNDYVWKLPEPENREKKKLERTYQKTLERNKSTYFFLLLIGRNKYIGLGICIIIGVRQFIHYDILFK